MSLNLQQLRAFTTIVATGSLGRAATELHLTQPALSRTIKRLETDLGAPLFERHSKGMELTAVGHALLPHAMLLAREAELAREEIDALRGLSKGTIKVGAVGAIASHVLPLAIDRVLTRWPNLRVEITEDIVAISDCHWQDDSFVVAGCDHPLRQKKRIALADTLGERWAIPPRGTAPYAHMQGVFEAHGLGLPNIVVETRSVPVLKSMVARCGFLTWMPEPMYDVEAKARVMDTLPIPTVRATRTLTAFRRRQGILPSPAVKLLDELRRLTASA
jgi:DNA-binding transcriptional LysR family regulator